MSLSHPWASRLRIRPSFDIFFPFDANDLDSAPHKFNDASTIRAPGQNASRLRECVTLQDVVAFRERTTAQKKAKASDDIAGSMQALTLSGFRIIYRFTDIIRNGKLAILEALHFEIFMPDRDDLRFIALPLPLLPADACEGDYFEIYSMSYTPRAAMMTAGFDYIVDWTVTQCCPVDRLAPPTVDCVYVAEKHKGTPDCRAVCSFRSSFIMLRQRRLEKSAGKLEAHKLYTAALVNSSAAWIYPVEPPKNTAAYAESVKHICSTSHYPGTYAMQICALSPEESARIADRLAAFVKYGNEEDVDDFMIRLFKIGVQYRTLITPPQRENVFVLSADGNVVLQVYSEVFVLFAVTLHFEEEDIKMEVLNIKREVLGRRKKSLIVCKRDARVNKVKHFAHRWMDATFHGGDKSPTMLVLRKIGNEMAKMRETGEKKRHFIIEEGTPPILDEIYGRGQKKKKYLTSGCVVVDKVSGERMRMNDRQSRAMEIYKTIENSGYCILSPPGSGKTTVAAAMAASLMEKEGGKRQGSVQLLLAVQNVAVENLAISLKGFYKNGEKPYRMLANLRLDPESPTPFDVNEHLEGYSRWMRNAESGDISKIKDYFKVDKEWREGKKRGVGQEKKEKLYGALMRALRDAKKVLESYAKPEVILSTVDLLLYRIEQLYDKEDGVDGQLRRVDRVVIDEASLLPESTLYALMRCFPKASFVLIGDDKQLPPFMYDEKVMGHELAGRSALNVSMKNANMPVIQLLEVYRAPQCLIEPYNHLSYGGQLVSHKREKLRPLHSAGLVPASRPDLLIVNIKKGTQKGIDSLYNEQEMEVLERLLRLFPPSMHDDIMIICLYKEQRKRLQRRLGPDYDVLTVDSSQGKERSVVIVLTTRTDKPSDFFNNQNRCTVAVSRQQRALIILGNYELLSNNHPWSKVLDDFTKIEPSDIPRPTEAAKSAPQAKAAQQALAPKYESAPKRSIQMLLPKTNQSAWAPKPKVHSPVLQAKTQASTAPKPTAAQPIPAPAPKILASTAPSPGAAQLAPNRHQAPASVLQPKNQASTPKTMSVQPAPAPAPKQMIQQHTPKAQSPAATTPESKAPQAVPAAKEKRKFSISVTVEGVTRTTEYWAVCKKGKNERNNIKERMIAEIEKELAAK